MLCIADRHESRITAEITEAIPSNIAVWDPTQKQYMQYSAISYFQQNAYVGLGYLFRNHRDFSFPIAIPSAVHKGHFRTVSNKVPWTREIPLSDCRPYMMAPGDQVPLALIEGESSQAQGSGNDNRGGYGGRGECGGAFGGGHSSGKSHWPATGNTGSQSGAVHEPTWSRSAYHTGGSYPQQQYDTSQLNSNFSSSSGTGQQGQSSGGSGAWNVQYSDIQKPTYQNWQG